MDEFRVKRTKPRLPPYCRSRLRAKFVTLGRSAMSRALSACIPTSHRPALRPRLLCWQLYQCGCSSTSLGGRTDIQRQRLEPCMASITVSAMPDTYSSVAQHAHAQLPHAGWPFVLLPTTHWPPLFCRRRSMRCHDSADWPRAHR